MPNKTKKSPKSEKKEEKESEKREIVMIDSEDEPIARLFEALPEESNDSGDVPMPPLEEEIEDVEIDKSQEARERKERAEEFDQLVEQQKLNRLKFLLEKTSIYSTFLAQQLVKPIVGSTDEPALSPKKKGGKKSGKRSLEATKELSPPSKKGKTEVDSSPSPSRKFETTFPQPKLLTGAVMRNYQLQGTEWLVSLYENGLNGILADEMGLGKTIQCIGLFAYLLDRSVAGPFLVVAPLSTLGNWIREINRFCPTIPALLYYGSKDEREELRKTQLTQRKIANTPIVVTSYELIIRDRKYLQKFQWKYIVVDEGHRLKNMNCKLIRELKTYSSANRLLLTGTPLQNKLAELWSLLNFLLPDIFDDLDSFQSWFDFAELGEKENGEKIIKNEEETGIVTKLHQILRPFLLRRIKADVELELPQKKERIVEVSLSPLQTKYYKAILEKNLGSLLTEHAKKQLKNRGTSTDMNMLMQLRKVCNHPYLFEWPLDAQGEELIDEKMVSASGKLMLLDRILPRLHKEGHRILIFSQMTRMLDILQDYFNLRGHTFRRIDGSTPQSDREISIREFNEGSDIFSFLLSTRAGGLGINLTGADTVIFFDNDWNPQIDLQAQDRCHRIGQTRPVRVYRFVSANSIESKILARQESKMKLERLVIQKGNFVGVQSKSGLSKEILQELLRGELSASVGRAVDISDAYLFDWTD